MAALSCCIFAVFLLSTVVHAEVSSTCEKMNIDLLLVVDATIKEDWKKPLTSALSPILTKVSQSESRIGLIAFDNMVHPLNTLHSVVPEEKSLVEMVKLASRVDKVFPHLKQTMDVIQPKTQSPQEILEMVFSVSKESPTAVNIGKALEAAHVMLKDSMTNRKYVARTVMSLDNPVAAAVQLKTSPNTQLITISLDNAGVENFASSSETAFALETPPFPEEFAQNILAILCKSALPQAAIHNSHEVDFIPGVMANACPPGYTGQYCNIAVCPIKGIAKPYVPGQYGYPIDMQVFVFCNGNTMFPVGSHAVNLTVLLITSTGGIPQLTLYKPNGQKLNMNETVYTYNDTELVYFEVPKPMFGKWRAVFTSVNRAICIFNPNEVSNMYVDPGFVQIRNNQMAPLVDKPNPVIYQGVPNFFIAHPAGLPCPGTITFLQVYENFALIWQSASQTRYHCAYEYYFGWIYCNSVSLYYYKVWGVDENGYLWERTDSMNCIAAPTPTPTPTPTCLNGGVMYNGNCVCTSTWTGPYCATPVCSNGGTVSGNNCICAPGWTGPFCRTDMCLKMNTNVVNGANSRSLSFVVQLTPSMFFDITQIQQQIDYLMSQINQQTVHQPGQSWFTKYILVTFDDVGAQTFLETYSQDLFKAAVGLLKTKTSTTTKTVKTMAAIQKALGRALPYSPVYIFTDSDPADYGNDVLIYPLLDATKNSLNFIFSSLNPNGMPFGQSFGTQAIIYISSISDGQHFVVGKPTVTPLIRVIPTHYSSGLVFEQTYPDCTNGQTVYFPMDSKTTSFTFYTAGQQPNAVIYGPDGSLYKPAPMVNGSAYIQILHVWKRSGTGSQNLSPGIYTAVVRTKPLSPGGSTACRFQVRAQSPLQVYYGFSGDPHNDVPAIEPTLTGGYTNRMVAHVSNLTSMGTLEYVNMVVWEYYFNATITGSAMFKPRVNCGYEWYSQLFRCPHIAFGLVITGYDGQGYMYQRLRVATCLPGSSTATPLPPMSTPGPSVCLNFVVDIIFVIDNSGNMGSAAFTAIKNMLSAFGRKFTISSADTRISFVTFNTGSKTETTFTKDTTQAQLQSSIQALPYAGDNVIGQNIESAFAKVQSLDLTAGGGYRPTVPNIVVLITSNSPTGNNPLNRAAEMKQKGLHFLCVGYGPNADMGILTNIAGKQSCTIGLQSTATFSQVLLPWLENKICRQFYC